MLVAVGAAGEPSWWVQAQCHEPWWVTWLLTAVSARHRPCWVASWLVLAVGACVGATESSWWLKSQRHEPWRVTWLVTAVAVRISARHRPWWVSFLSVVEETILLVSSSSTPCWAALSLGPVSFAFHVQNISTVIVVFSCYAENDVNYDFGLVFIAKMGY